MKKSIYILALLLFILNINIQAQNKTAKTHYTLGERAIGKNDFREAITQFTKALKIDPKFYQVLERRCLAYMLIGEMDSAMTDATIATTENKNSADAHNVRGLIFEQIKFLDSAINEYNIALKLSPNFGEAYLNRSTAMVSSGFYDIGMKDLDSAEKFIPKNPSVHYRRAKILIRQKKYDEAVVSYNKAISMGMNTGELYLSRGNAYFKGNKFEEAILDFNKAIKMDSTLTDAFNNRAIAYDKTGKPELAEKDRNFLKSISGLDLKPIDKLEYKPIVSPDSLLNLQLPDGWKYQYFPKDTEDVVKLFLWFPNLIDTNLSAASINLFLNFNMGKHYGVHAPDSLLEFFKGSTAKNGQDMARFHIFSQKTFMHNNWAALRLEIMDQIEPGSPVLQEYDLAFAIEDILFYGHFQCPEKQFDYFKNIFERCINSIYIKLY